MLASHFSLRLIKSNTLIERSFISLAKEVLLGKVAVRYVQGILTGRFHLFSLV